MAFNIQNFADNLSAYGSLQTNKFEVRIPLPPPAAEILTFRADRVDMPGVLFDAVDAKRYGVGPLIKTPSNTSRFNEVSVSFIETQQAEIYKIMSAWMQTIVDYGGVGAGSPGLLPTFLAGYKDSYATEIQIRVFNNTGASRNSVVRTGAPPQPIIQLNLIEAFPISLGDTNLSWSNNNELFRTTAVFAYTHHRLVDPTPL